MKFRNIFRECIKLSKQSLIIAIVIFTIDSLTGKNWPSIAYLFIKDNWIITVAIYLIIVVFSAIYLNISYFSPILLNVVLSPFLMIFYPFLITSIKKYLKDFDQDVPKEAVVILAHSDWKDLKTLIKHDFALEDIKAIVSYLTKKGSNFAFYWNATIEDVHKIMSNKEIREVFFLGHGDSCSFQLSSDEELFYCDFSNREKYGKDYVHQVHCGSPDGKNLIDYVVPDENKSKCFFFEKYISSNDMVREFKRLEGEIS